MIHLQEVTIKFAGDSGDGMQLTGAEFTGNTALTGSDLATFPDFPAEIRAPQGTLAGVSGFQLHFGSRRVYTPGDKADVLVAMNAAALKSNLHTIKKGGMLIINTDGFDHKNLRLAHYSEGENPLENNTLDHYEVYKIDISKLTREALKDIALGTKEKERSKNMFVLGFLYWLYNRDMKSTLDHLNDKFKNKPELLQANILALKAGFHYGDTTEAFAARFKVSPADDIPKGQYRLITGNEAIGIGLICAAQKSGLPLFYGSYPITPASDILHFLARQKHFGVKTFQAEDEIAAICAAIGAGYGGNLAVTGTSGPGLALKAEAIGLAVMLELPLLILNIQRGGPSTGLPTKTEQADLMQALYGRNGECPLPVIAPSSPADCFDVALAACRMAIEFMTPVILLSDGYLANSAEPWCFPNADQIKPIEVRFKQSPVNGETFLPYQRNEKLARPWAIPGTVGLQHRIGGLEKENDTGNISYSPANHAYMVKIREAKIEQIANYLPPQTIDNGPERGDLLIVGWGSTCGTIRAATRDLLAEGYQVAHLHIRHLRPLPLNIGKILQNYKHVLVAELNNGQLVKILREKFLLPCHAYNKVQGLPFSTAEIVSVAKDILNAAIKQ